MHIKERNPPHVLTLPSGMFSIFPTCRILSHTKAIYLRFVYQMKVVLVLHTDIYYPMILDAFTVEPNGHLGQLNVRLLLKIKILNVAVNSETATWKFFQHS